MLLGVLDKLYGFSFVDLNFFFKEEGDLNNLFLFNLFTLSNFFLFFKKYN